MTETNKTVSVLPVCAIILAAGESKRFGPENKLLVEVDGVPALERVVNAIKQSGVERLAIVSGSDHEAIASLLSGYDVNVIKNPNWKQGMGGSLSAGASTIDESQFSGILICLGDLPFVESTTIAKLLETFLENGAQKIILPTNNGIRGHPVIFPVFYRKELMRLSGDQGAKSIISAAGESLLEIEIASDQIFRDIDRPSDFAD